MKIGHAVQAIGAVVGLCTIAYGVYVIAAYYEYGHPPHPRQSDALLDAFMPIYDVREERDIHVEAPAALSMRAARYVSLNDSPIVRAIFKGREFILGAKPEQHEQPRAFVDLVQSIGWRLLVHVPDREMVFGAVTQPWKADVVFHGIPPERFRSFHDPDYVKIVWTLHAEPLASNSSRFTTETRAVATDAGAREKFRRYWAAYSPGIILIRLGALPLIKSDAERRYRRHF